MQGTPIGGHPEHKAARPVSVLGIIFDDFPMDDRLFNLIPRDVACNPLLGAMDSVSITPQAYCLGD